MVTITLALGLSYITLAVLHSKAVEKARRNIWLVAHSVMLTIMGILYLLYGMGFALH